MSWLYTLYTQPQTLILILVILLVWELIWKGISLWYAARHSQQGWFIALLILNTAGILPILYLIFAKPPGNREKREVGKEIQEVLAESKSSHKMIVKPKTRKAKSKR